MPEVPRKSLSSCPPTCNLCLSMQSLTLYSPHGPTSFPTLRGGAASHKTMAGAARWVWETRHCPVLWHMQKIQQNLYPVSLNISYKFALGKSCCYRAPLCILTWVPKGKARAVTCSGVHCRSSRSHPWYFGLAEHLRTQGQELSLPRVPLHATQHGTLAWSL